MNGILALQGGGPFVANDDLDRRLIAAAGATRVIMLPTADAYEHPELLVAAAMLWGERLDVEVEALMVMRRGEAMEDGVVGVIRGARAVYLVGDQPLHLRSVLKGTPLWDAIVQVVASGGLVAATGGSAAAMCDPMVDPRGGAFTLGLGLIDGLALVTEAETWSTDRLHRTLKLANTPIVELPSGSALVHTTEGWERVGEMTVHGELP
ncbi:MAG: Type 1 glutamine amidotransferase-like domain-containing protein [Ilumatobacteraceae bacterium]|nr:Type 1 glutamine amidotransferase-like domain-containing protein [Ilumatobacteraceae bacterium]